jgi:hypothetical protein
MVISWDVYAVADCFSELFAASTIRTKNELENVDKRFLHEYKGLIGAAGKLLQTFRRDYASEAPLSQM